MTRNSVEDSKEVRLCLSYHIRRGKISDCLKDYYLTNNRAIWHFSECPSN